MQDASVEIAPSIGLLEGYDLKKGEVNVDGNYRKGFTD